MSELTAPIFDIRRCSLSDGPGVRTTFFFKGCSLHCAWCHNPESQKREPQRIRYQNRCTGCGTCVRHCPSNALAVIGDGSLNYMEEYCTHCGKCALYCPHDAVSIAGEEKTVRELFDIACQDIEYFGDDGGITVSGGECMLYPGFLYEFLSVCRGRGIRTAVDTAGFVPWNAFETVLPATDLFLYDIKCISPEYYRQYVGSDGIQILDNYRRLHALGVHIIVRIPVIPELHLSEDGKHPSQEFLKIVSFLSEYHPAKVELLPYHKLGEHKYDALGYQKPFVFSVPTREQTAELSNAIRYAGIRN